MQPLTINLISLTVRKWDLESRKIAFMCYFVLKDNEESFSLQIALLPPAEMVEELLGKLKFMCEKKLAEQHPEEQIEIEYENNSFIRQKLFSYFKKISFELGNNKRKPGATRAVHTTHMDVYNQKQDISFLHPEIQFYVILNWARFYYERERYAEAIGPLQKLVELKPDYGIAYKWLARSLKKTRKFDEATFYYEKYAEVDGSLDSLLDLGKAYRKGKLFKKSEEIYNKILKDDPDNKEARFGIAQILYALKNQDYMKVLEKLYEDDAEWLKSWLLEEFNFRIYVQQKTYLSPVQAAKFLGYEKVFELTQLAFKNQVPSHFNPARAKISFYQEELENWARVMNRFNCLERTVKLYPEELQAFSVVEESSHHGRAKNHRPQRSEGKSAAHGAMSTRVEEIIMRIRSRRGQMPPQNGAEVSETAEGKENEPVKKRRGRPPKSAAAKAPESKAEAAPEPPKRRGRPPKQKAAAETAEPPKEKTTKSTSPDSQKSGDQPRRRGRPPKKKAEVEEEKPKKKRGRPPKNPPKRISIRASKEN